MTRVGLRPPRAVDSAGGEKLAKPLESACLSHCRRQDCPGPSPTALSSRGISWLALLPWAPRSSPVSENLMVAFLLVCRAHAWMWLCSFQSMLHPALLVRLSLVEWLCEMVKAEDQDLFYGGAERWRELPKVRQLLWGRMWTPHHLLNKYLPGTCLCRRTALARPREGHCEPHTGPELQGRACGDIEV